jgi:hypothetical protein
MSSARSEHRFECTAALIAAAANGEADYHAEREGFWRREMVAASDIVRATAGVRVELVPITGGHRPEVTVFYGDPAAYARMQEAHRKAEEHMKAKDRYLFDANVYGSQSSDKVYLLDADDIHYFRLGGEPRPE